MRWLIALSVVLALVLLGALTYTREMRRVHMRTIAHEAGRRVELFQQKSALVGDGVGVSVESWRGDRRLETRWIDNRDLWEDFPSRYPDARWLGPDVLELGRAEAFARDQTGTLRVRNDTDRTASLVSLQAGDSRFLVFDLAPGAEVELPFVLNTWLEWIAVESWRDGEALEASVNFITRCDAAKRSEFRISLAAPRTTIENADFERLGSGGT